jgi:hypothetical protein
MRFNSKTFFSGYSRLAAAAANARSFFIFEQAGNPGNDSLFRRRARVHRRSGRSITVITPRRFRRVSAPPVPAARHVRSRAAAAFGWALIPRYATRVAIRAAAGFRSPVAVPPAPVPPPSAGVP